MISPPRLALSQVGSGTTELGARPWLGKRGYFDDAISDAEFEEERARALSELHVHLRDKEHLAYFRAFRRACAYFSHGIQSSGNQKYSNVLLTWGFCRSR